MNDRALLLLLPLALFSTQDQEVEAVRYLPREIRGWSVQVEASLTDPDDALGREVLELLDHKLYDLGRVLPSAAVEKLQGVTIWMERDNERDPGGVYHPSAAWLRNNGYDPALAKCVQFGNAKNFIGWSFDQPWMVLHELAHAYHDQVLGKGNAVIAKAFQAATESGTYESVLRTSGRRERAYGLNNTDEYFAELSEAYFGTNDFYPFVRAELRECDPGGYAMVESLWGARRVKTSSK